MPWCCARERPVLRSIELDQQLMQRVCPVLRSIELEQQLTQRVRSVLRSIELEQQLTQRVLALQYAAALCGQLQSLHVAVLPRVLPCWAPSSPRMRYMPPLFSKEVKTYHRLPPPLREMDTHHYCEIDYSDSNAMAAVRR